MFKSTKKTILMILIFMFLLYFLVYIAAICKRKYNRDNYAEAKKYIALEDYSKATDILEKISTYKDVNKLLKEVNDGKTYEKANESLNKQNYKEAIKTFEKIADFKDSKEKIKQAKYMYAIQLFDEGKYSEAEKLFIEVKDYDKSEWYLAQINVKNREKSNKTIYDEACTQLKEGNYSEALEGFNSIIDYKDSKEKIKLCKKYIEEAQRLNLSQTISAGVKYVLAITKDNEVKVTGDTSFGKCNVDFWKDIVSIDGYGEVTIGLKNDGTVETAGNLSEIQKRNSEGWKHIVDIAAGYKHVVALKSNGEVVTEGHNGNGQRDLDSWKNKKVIDIDAGWSTTVGLTEDGKLLFAGKKSKELKDEYNSKKKEWKDVIKISVSGGEPNVKSNSRGDIHVVGLKADKTVVHLGVQPRKQKNKEDDTLNWKNIVDISAGDWYTVGLTRDGKVLITGDNYPYGKKHTKYIDEEKIKKWSKIKGIAAGYGTTLVLKNNGKLDIMGFTDGEEYEDNELSKVLNWSNIKTNPKK